MDRYQLLRSRYYFKPVILKLKLQNKTNKEIGELLDISKSTVDYITNGQDEIRSNKKIDELIGKDNPEDIRISAEYACMELFANKGWSIAKASSISQHDLFCLKNDKIIKIQVRSSTVFSARGFPRFKTNRIVTGAGKAKRIQFKKGDFDFWYFYSINKDAWLIPFDVITSKSEVSMEGYDEYII